METMNTTGIVPTMDYSRNNDGFDNSSWFWVIIILFAFWGNGFNGRNNGLETDIDTRFLERDIFNTNTSVLESNNALTRDILENRFTCSQNACATQKEVIQNRYDTSLGLANIDKDILLGNQNLQAQLSSCCCTLENAIHREGEATRNQMQQDKIDQLREQVNTTNLALFGQTLVNQILPRSVPAYPSCSPYVPSNYGYNGCGCGNTTII